MDTILVLFEGILYYEFKEDVEMKIDKYGQTSVGVVEPNCIRAKIGTKGAYLGILPGVNELVIEER